MFKEKRMVYREVPGGAEPENSKPQDSKEKVFNPLGELTKFSGEVASEATEPKVVKIDEAQQLANMFGVFGNGEESLMGEMDFILDGKLIQVEELCKQKANYADIMNFIKSKSADEMRVENALLAMSQSDPKVKSIYDEWMKKTESLYKNLLADARYEEASSFSLVDVKVEDTETSEDAEVQEQSLAGQSEFNEYKTNKCFEVLRKIGISQSKIDRVFNDVTNPYISWALDTLGGFDAKQIKIERQSKNTYGEFYSINLDRFLGWESKIYPKLLDVIGGEDNYFKYGSAINTAVLKGAPRMREFLRWHFDKVISNPLGFSEMNRLVKDELDGIMRGVNVKQLIKEDEDVRGAQRRKMLEERGAEEEKGKPEAAKNVNGPADVDPLPKGAISYKQTKPSEEMMKIMRQSNNYGKYSNVMNKVKELINEKKDDKPISEDEYDTVNRGLDDLTSEVTETDPRLQALSSELNKIASIVDGMAAKGANYSEISAYMSAAIEPLQIKNLYKSDVDKEALNTLMQLFESKISAIYDYYGIQMVGETITKEE